MAISIVLVLLVVISVVLHFLSPWWFTPLASNWGAIDDTINITFWVTGFVFIAVNAFLAYVVWRYRYNKNRKADYEPENKKLEGWLTLLTTIGVAAMLAPGLIVWDQFVHVPEDADTFEAVGAQWQWSFRLPGEDQTMGEVGAGFVDEKNPLGINPKDPAGQDDIVILSNEMHLPVNRPVKALLRSQDVLHNFAVPQFRVKMDLVPGMVTYLWFTPEKTGTYEILCEELCGFAHFTMRGKVVVDEQEDYETWLTKFPTFAQTQAPKAHDLAAGEAAYMACSSCHGADGAGNAAMNAPSLAGQPDWYLSRQLNYYKNGVRGVHEKDEYGKQMAAMTALLPTEEAIENVSAYIATFPPVVVTPTVDGNPEAGRVLYGSCGACHGADGKGNYATNAPSLAGQQDWYLKRTIENFKLGVRGGHPSNLYGQQMILMAKTLRNDEDINDLISYVNTLR